VADRAIIIGKVVCVLRRLLRSPARLRGADPGPTDTAPRSGH
jgi:hypothetical protein